MFRNKVNYLLRKLALKSVDMSTTKKAKKRLQVVYENDTTEPSNSKRKSLKINYVAGNCKKHFGEALEFFERFGSNLSIELACFY